MTRAPAALIAIALALVVGGCGETPPPAASATPREYLTAVAALTGPPAEVASLAAERLAPGAGAAPAERDLMAVLARARRALARLQELRLADPGLVAQRDALADAYPAVILRMQAVIDAVAADDRRTLEGAARALFQSLRELPSDVARPPSS